MRSVSVRLADLCKITIPIGFVGENLHTQVKIDCMKLFEEYPDALVALSVKPAEGDAYPAVVTREGNFIIWDITDSDLVHQGVGEFQLSFIVDQIVAKSYIGKVRVDRSIISAGEDIPDPVDDWLIKANATLEKIDEAIPEGGTEGQVLAKASDNDYDTHWVDQSGGAVIDDTAGAGDTDKTWSADKLVSDVLRRENAEGSTVIQNYEGGVYDIGYYNGNLEVYVPYKRIEIGDGAGIYDFKVRRQIDGKAVNVHFLHNDGVVAVGVGTIGSAYEGMISVETINAMQQPPMDPNYIHMTNMYRLFSVASTAETQAIITEYAG